METTFFQDAGVAVTNSRFVTNGQTYALSGVTSVSKYIDHPKRGTPILTAIVGIIAYSTSKSVLILLLFIGLAIWLWVSKKTTYSVMIRSSSGESRALTDLDDARVDKIISALNDAIIHRG